MRNLYRYIVIAAAALISAGQISAEVPVSYYQTVDGLSDSALKSALSKLIYNHQKVSSYNALPDYFEKTDAYYENGVQYWWDMYSDIPVPTNIRFGEYMNREHCFPKSWWGGSTSTPAYVDLYHLYPSEAKANQAKSNYPLGEVSTSTFDNGVVKVGYAVTGQGGGAALVFEPNEEYKGDFARTYFYMVTCYQSLKWEPKYMYMLQQNDYPTLKPWAVDLLLEWARKDPVSQKEVDRNEKVYKIQSNRNPFIDYPDLCEYIWGNKKGLKFDIGAPSEPTGDPELVTPVQDTALDFTQVALGKSTTSRLYFAGHNLKGNLSLTISGADRGMFSIESRTLSSSLVNADGGTSIVVTYTPTAVGRHTARLIVSDGGLTGSIGIGLNAECLEVPTLSRPVALPASDITESYYNANWEAPAEVVDYYIVSRTRYSGGSSSTEEILAEENSLVIDDFNGSDSESYNVRSVRLGYESPRSEEIFVEHSGVIGVEVDSPLGWAYYEGGVRVVCGTTHTNALVYDISGRLVKVIPELNNNDIITLPLGAFIIVTDQCSTPIRVLVN